MPWIEALLRQQRVYAKVHPDGTFAEENGLVEIRYKPSDGRAYRARGNNLEKVANRSILPDDFCAPATPVESPPRTQQPPKAADSPLKTGPVPSGAHEHAKTSGQSTQTEHTSNVYIVYTDGACSGNPGPAGSSFVVIAPDGTRTEGGEYLGTATNNIAELTAVLLGVQAVKDKQAVVRLHTDSSYSIGVLQKGWKAKANPELVQSIRKELSERPHVTLVYVPGHKGVELNERADELARLAVQNRRGFVNTVKGKHG